MLMHYGATDDGTEKSEKRAKVYASQSMCMHEVLPYLLQCMLQTHRRADKNIEFLR